MESNEIFIPDICHERHEYTRVNFFWPVDIQGLELGGCLKKLTFYVRVDPPPLMVSLTVKYLCLLVGDSP